MTCRICRTNPVIAKGRCGTCYTYFYRNGKDRPEKLAKRQPELNYRRWQKPA